VSFPSLIIAFTGLRVELRMVSSKLLVLLGSEGSIEGIYGAIRQVRTSLQAGHDTEPTYVALLVHIVPVSMTHKQTQHVSEAIAKNLCPYIFEK